MESVQLKTLSVTNLNINPVFSALHCLMPLKHVPINFGKIQQSSLSSNPSWLLLKFPRFSPALCTRAPSSQFPRYLGDSKLRAACVLVTAHLPTATLSNMTPSLTIQRKNKAKVRWFLLVNPIKILLSSFLPEKVCPI